MLSPAPHTFHCICVYNPQNVVKSPAVELAADLLIGLLVDVYSSADVSCILDKAGVSSRPWSSCDHWPRSRATEHTLFAPALIHKHQLLAIAKSYMCKQKILHKCVHNVCWGHMPLWQRRHAEPKAEASCFGQAWVAPSTQRLKRAFSCSCRANGNFLNLSRAARSASSTHGTCCNSANVISKTEAAVLNHLTAVPIRAGLVVRRDKPDSDSRHSFMATFSVRIATLSIN